MGEIVLFDRSWYNRAGVERVVGFCSEQQYHRFMRQTPVLKILVNSGIMLFKMWFPSAGQTVPALSGAQEDPAEAVEA